MWESHFKHFLQHHMSSVLKQRLLFQLASMSIYQQKRKCMCNHMPSSKEGINNIGVYIYIFINWAHFRSKKEEKEQKTTFYGFFTV